MNKFSELTLSHLVNIRGKLQRNKKDTSLVEKEINKRLFSYKRSKANAKTYTY